MRNLNPSQLQQLLAAIELRSPFGKRDYLLILFLYHTGLRVSECSGLLTCLVSKNGRSRDFLDLPASLCKGPRGRVVPLNKTAKSCIEKLLVFNHQHGFSVAPAAPLFQNRCHGPLSVRSIQKIVEHYRKAADLDVRATPHTLRHTFASSLVSRGASLPAVQKLLGHRHLSSTQVYTHVDPRELQRSIELLVS